MAFIAAFEFSSGPIVWLYNAEIMQDKSVSIAAVLNWLMNLMISVITPSLVNTIGITHIGYIFISVGIITSFGTLFIYKYMKETKGKS
jgi:SP family facilitated glucose transporter-like MFS transporter 1